MTNEEFIKAISFDGEEWKDVVGFEGSYMVSSFGRVVSLDREGIRKNRKRPFIPKYTINNKGYKVSRLWDGKCTVNKYTHRLVAEAFLKNEENQKQIDHINTDRLDNRVENLKWCSPKENQNNPLTRKHISESKTGIRNRPLFKPVVGINIFDEKDVRFYESMIDVEKDGFRLKDVSQVCRYKRNTHMGFIWYYKSEYDRIINKSKNSSNPE